MVSFLRMIIPRKILFEHSEILKNKMKNKCTLSESNSEIISILLSQDDELTRSALIQKIQLKFERIAHYKGIHVDDIDDVVNGGL